MLYILFLLSFASLSFSLPVENSFFPKFEQWKAKYDKEYANDMEEMHRFRVFSSNFVKILKHNSHPENTYTMKMNRFGDLTQHEFWMEYIRNSYPASSNDNDCTYYAFQNTSLPKSVDWRHVKGVVSDVKDQGQCGSCWAFSTVEVLESAHYLHTNKSVVLSPQELVDCSQSFGNNGCNGGLMNSSFEYVISNHGLCSEDDVPYTASDDECDLSSCHTRYAQITNCYNIQQGDQLAMQEVVSRQPISIAIEADTSVFQFYNDGIITGDDCGQNLDHGVVIVGYGTHNSIDYWVVRNSWGEFWGNKGYVYIQRDNSHNSDGVCGIGMASSFPSFD